MLWWSFMSWSKKTVSFDQAVLWKENLIPVWPVIWGYSPTACAWLLLVQSAEPLNYLNRDTLMKNECLTPSTLTLNPPHQMSYEQKFGFSAY